MAFRFRRSIRLFPGVRVNISKSGTSLSVGRRGATMNFSSHGARATIGLPGTGLSYRGATLPPVTPSERRSLPAAAPLAAPPAPAQPRRAWFWPVAIIIAVPLALIITGLLIG